MKELVSIKDLSVSFNGDDGKVTALDRIDLSIPEGKTVCLVGESGCGKSVTARALLRTLDRNASLDNGEIHYRQRSGAVVDLAAYPKASSELKAIQGNEITMIYQEPMSYLSPLYTIGNQIVEVLLWHREISKAEARSRAIDILAQVGLPNPELRFSSYSFELSGGMLQRAMIAMALVTNPRLLIADEPTTALDVTTQATILDLMRRLQRERRMSMLFITHDLGVVANIADEVVIMYLGVVVEHGTVEQVLASPLHPYTQGLLAALPGKSRGPLFTIPGTVPTLANRPPGCPFHERCVHAADPCRRDLPWMTGVASGARVRCHGFLEGSGIDLTASRRVTSRTDVFRAIDRSVAPILRLESVSKHFSVRSGIFNRRTGTVEAVNDVSFDLWEGETLGLVGESGCGKSTLGRTIMGLHRATSGRVEYSVAGKMIDLTRLKERALRPYWKDLRMIFQDPYSSLNPRMTVFDIIAEVLRVNSDLGTRKDIEMRVSEVMEKIGFSRDFLKRYPHAFSGGQRQRIGIARALAPYPRVIIADEPVSALDISVQAQILNLLKDLQQDLGLTYIFISHDLGVVAHISDRVAVMYAGRIVELGETDDIFNRPYHPYTDALIGSILEPVPDRTTRSESQRLEGGVPDPLDLPSGCPFAPRCRHATEICQESNPELIMDENGRQLACHHPEAARECRARSTRSDPAIMNGGI